MHKANIPSGASQPGLVLVSPENPNDRMGVQQPGGEPIDMMPPPSPVMGDPSEDMDEGGLDEVQSGSDGSPWNQGTGPQTPSEGGGAAPPTPVPNQQQNPGQQQGHGMAVPLAGADLDGDSWHPTYMMPNIQHMQQQGQDMATPPPSSMLGVPPPPSVPSATSVADNLFSSDFIQSVASSLDDFDPSIFRSDNDINFERDFGQWFNHPNIWYPNRPR